MPVQVKAVNSWTADQAASELSRCCGARRWISAMVARRPFKDAEDLYSASEQVWWSLDREDWLEAFSHHPKIGDRAGLARRLASTASWSKKEQEGVSGSSEEILSRLADGNIKYQEKFGYIFIVCASGKAADEMLSILESRLDNAPGDELRIAAAEQIKITRLRLEKLCQEARSQATS